MKQLIHSSGPTGCPTIIAAFNNKAYTLISSLENGEDAVKQLAVELVPENYMEPQEGKEEESTNKATSSEEDIHQKDSIIEKEGSKVHLKYTVEDQKKDNSIQAVACHWKPNNSELLCAVSRCDKTVDIYRITKDFIKCQSTNNSDVTINKIKPILSHKAVKRCCTLAFASIPSEDTTKDPSMIIVAGDLNGDAIAYMAESREDVKTGQVSKVLLGHTASVLTSIEIIDGGKESIIFTADRDEKVRVSSFPQTYHVQGYLLGNSSYISDLKIVRSNITKCVTCGGDGTLRLFDYESYQEDAVVNIPYGFGGDIAREDEDSNSNIPVRIAINKDGTALVVIYDALNIAQVFTIEEKTNGGFALNHIFDIECQSTPLGIVFDSNSNNVLNILTQKEKIIRIRCDIDDHTYKTTDDKLETLIKQLNVPLTMPQSLLETNEFGQLKLKKKNLEESVAKNEPWLNVERKTKYKESQRRRKRRKFQQEKEFLSETS